MTARPLFYLLLVLGVVALKGQEPSIVCEPISTDRTYIRAEGISEALGDLAFRCRGTAPAGPLRIRYPLRLVSTLLRSWTPKRGRTRS